MAIIVAVNEGWKHVLQEPSIVLRHEVLHPERSTGGSSCRRRSTSRTCDGSQAVLVTIVWQRRVARHGGGSIHLLHSGGAAADGQLLHGGGAVVVMVALLLLLRRRRRLQESESERVEGVGAAAGPEAAERRRRRRRRHPEVRVHVVEAAHRVVVRGGEEVRAPAQRGGDGVRVLALVRGDHHRRVLVRPLHPLLHRALLRRAPVVAPAHALYICTPRVSQSVTMLSLAPRENPNYSWIARASVYVPRKWAVLDSFLAVLAPPVAVLEVVDLALGHEREPRLPGPLLALALALVGRPADDHTHMPTCIIDQSIYYYSNMHAWR